MYVAGLRPKGADVCGIVRACGLKPIDCRGVIAIQQVEHFEQHLRFHALSQVKALRKAYVHVDECRRRLGIPCVQRPLTGEVETRSIEQAISVEVRTAGKGTNTVMKTALCAEDPSNLHFPGQLPYSVRQEGVI